MQSGSTVSIKIKNPVLVKILKQYPVLSFKIRGDEAEFIDDAGEECVQYEQTPSKLEEISSFIAEGFEAYCDDEGRTAFEEACEKNKQKILDAYETVYWDYSESYPLEESLEDHVDASWIEKFRRDFAEKKKINVDEVDEDEFQGFLDDVTWIRCDESFHYRKGLKKSLGEYDCNYTIL